jgi:hypothetical protein
VTDDPRVGGLAGDEPLNEEGPAEGGDDPHALEENTAEGWRGAEDAAGNTGEQAARGLEQAQEQPGYGREGS